MIILSGVIGEDSGAVSGLVQTMQQVGGAPGIAVLVTRFGNAARGPAESPTTSGSASDTDRVLAEAMGPSSGWRP